LFRVLSNSSPQVEETTLGIEPAPPGTEEPDGGQNDAQIDDLDDGLVDDMDDGDVEDVDDGQAEDHNDGDVDDTTTRPEL
jgi:hypothetical protein